MWETIALSLLGIFIFITMMILLVPKGSQIVITIIILSIIAALFIGGGFYVSRRFDKLQEIEEREKLD